MMKRRLLCCLLAASMLTAACGDEDTGAGPDPGSGPSPDGGVARLRVVHAEAKVSSFDVLVDHSLAWNDLLYRTASDYLELESGRHHVEFVTTSGTMSDLDMVFDEGSAYTVIPCCSMFPLPYTLLADGDSIPASGNAMLRVVDFATAAASVNIYLTAPGTDLAAETPSLTLNILDPSDYIEMPTGDYQLRITPWDSQTILVDSTLTLGAGQVRTAIVVDTAGGGDPYSLLVLEDLN